MGLLEATVVCEGCSTAAVGDESRSKPTAVSPRWHAFPLDARVQDQQLLLLLLLLLTHLFGLGSEPVERHLVGETPLLVASFPLHVPVPYRPLNPLLGLLPRPNG